eukprot:Nk52_evm36s2630 gene=Nk52_evmTU36s2630
MEDPTNVIKEKTAVIEEGNRTLETDLKNIRQERDEIQAAVVEGKEKLSIRMKQVKNRSNELIKLRTEAESLKRKRNTLEISENTLLTKPAYLVADLPRWTALNIALLLGCLSILSSIILACHYVSDL